MGAAGEQFADFDAILAEAPKARRIVGLIHDPRLPSFAQVALLHAPSYYVARNGGEDAFSFKRTMSLPVHYRPDDVPPPTPQDFEWRPNLYRPDAPFARYFDLVLLKSADEEEADPRDAIWGDRASSVDIVAHRGAWWLLDTKRLP